MPVGTCPDCDKMIDIDGYVEHGHPTLFYCECGKVYDMPEFMELVEVPVEDVDLSGLEGKWPISEDYYSTDKMSRGLFISKTRWKQEEQIKIDPQEA